MNNKFKLRLTELILILMVSILTLIFNPPLPLLGIPLVILPAMRSIFITLEDSIDKETSQ